MTVRRLLRLLCLLAAAVLVGACGSDDAPDQAATTIAPTTTATPATTAAGRTYAFRGMTIALRPEWKAEVNVDEGATVRTGQPCGHSDRLGSDLCPAFQILGPDGIAHGYGSAAGCPGPARWWRVGGVS